MELTSTTQALKNGLTAYGAKFIKPGFAFTPEDDLAFALGYPYMVSIREETAKEKIQEEADIREAVSKFCTKDYLVIGGIWPKLIALSITNDWQYYSSETLELRSNDNFTQEEIIKIIYYGMDSVGAHKLFYILEAFVGPEIVTDAYITHLEAISIEEWDSVSNLSEFRFILLRLTEPDWKKAIARLENLYQKLAKLELAKLPRGFKRLDVLLHGVEGAERNGYRPDRENLSSYDLVYVEDNAEWVTEQLQKCGKPDKWSTPNPRIAFLGGEKALSIQLNYWKDYKSTTRGLMIQDFGKIKSPLVLKFMLEIGAADKKKEAIEWFLDHKDYSRKFLEEASKKTDEEGKLAKEILTKFS